MTDKPKTPENPQPTPAPSVPRQRPEGSSASGTDILSAAASGEIRDQPAPAAPAVPRTQRPETTPEPAPKPPEARSLTLPAHYWQNLDRVAERAGVTVDVWLERYLLNQVGR